MPTYYITPMNKQDKLATVNAGQVEAWLRGKGQTVNAVSLRSNEDGTVTIVIEAPEDPTIWLNQLDPEPDERQTAEAFLITIKPKLLDGTATPIETRNAVLALTVLAGF
jgi:hypothetical protein